ncbi:nitrogen fixation protein FixH [Cycloclasticus sp. 44_32_T64]|nr:nitrogen fixation protein FixH [Cycloclasticus sp. 44_32_T64]
MMHNLSEDTLPWYKQFWPWFLILLPLTVVIASVITFIIAQNNKPSLVSGNYYKEGLAINSNKKLEETAKKLGLTATISTNSTAITLQLANLENQPAQILVKLRHATISQHDQSLSLVKIADGIYQSPFILPKQGKWYISINDPTHTWEIKSVSYLSNK